MRTINSNAMLLKTDQCHHRPRSKAHINEYENNIHKAYNKPYRLGAAPAVVGTPSRCCPAATVPAAVVFARGFRCCFVVIGKKKKEQLAIPLMLLLKLLQNNTM